MALLKTWALDIVGEARKQGLSVTDMMLRLYRMGEGLPLDAIKKDALVEWKCPRKVEPDEVPQLEEALAQVRAPAARSANGLKEHC